MRVEGGGMNDNEGGQPGEVLCSVADFGFCCEFALKRPDA